MKKRIPVKCSECGQTLLKKGEKWYGHHITSQGCTDAIVRNINRTFDRAKFNVQRLQKARQLLDEASAEINNLVSHE